MKNQKGITLIALVVTIVVLLILAAVSIAMLRGDSGIITNAQKAKYSNTQGEVVDKMLLAFNGVKTEIKVKEATVVGYKAQSDETNLTTLLNTDLSTATDTRYTVSLADHVYTLTYTDNDFKTGGKYAPISCTISITNNDATLGDNTPNKPVQ